MQYQLNIDVRNLHLGLRIFRAPRKVQPRDRAILGFDGTNLTIEAFDQTILVRAEGIWPGNAQVSASLIKALIEVPPMDEQIAVCCDGHQVVFGSMKVACKWQPVSSVILARPSQPEWMEAIGLKYTLPRARIFAEGRISEVKAAERKLSALINRVAMALAPMGVTVADVEALVERRLEERYGVGR